MRALSSVFLYIQPENNRRCSQMLLLEAVDGLFLGHTFACDSPPIKAAARSTMDVAGAWCGRLTLKILWRWPTFYTWLKTQREKGLLSDPEQRWPEDNLLWSKKKDPFTEHRWAKHWPFTSERWSPEQKLCQTMVAHTRFRFDTVFN